MARCLVDAMSRLRRRIRSLGPAGTPRGARAARPRHGFRSPRSRARGNAHRVGSKRNDTSAFRRPRRKILANPRAAHVLRPLRPSVLTNPTLFSSRIAHGNFSIALPVATSTLETARRPTASRRPRFRFRRPFDEPCRPRVAFEATEASGIRGNAPPETARECHGSWRGESFRTRELPTNARSPRMGSPRVLRQDRCVVVRASSSDCMRNCER